MMIKKILFLLAMITSQICSQPNPTQYYKILQEDSLYYLLTDKAIFKFYSHEASGEFYLTRYMEDDFKTSTKLMLNDGHLFISKGDSIFIYSNDGAGELSFENVFIPNYNVTEMCGFGPCFFIRTGNFYNLLKVQDGEVVSVEDSLFTQPSQALVFFYYPYVVIAQTVYKYVEGFDFYQVGNINIGNGNTGLTGDSLISYAFWYDPLPYPTDPHSELIVDVIEEPSFPHFVNENWGLNIPQLHENLGWGTMIVKKNLYYMTWVNVITTRNSQLAYLPAQTDQVFITDNYIFLLGDSVRFSKWYEGSTFYPFNWTDITNIKDEINKPSAFALYHNFPNPFNPATKIRYGLPELSEVNLTVYDALGREVEPLVNEEKPAGRYEVEFDGTNLPSGVYFYRVNITSLESNETFVKTAKMILLK